MFSNLKRSVPLSLLILMTSTFASWANDGAFYARGGNIFPMKETSIQLRKEILKLTIVNGYVYVDVKFHFYNPASAKNLTVGFVTPPPSGDVPTDSKPGIELFTVQVAGENLEYRIEQLTEPNEKLGYYGDEFLYLFDMKFKPGITFVEHTYRVKLSTLLGVIFDFRYILQTGLTWANDQIDDFTLIIQFDGDTHFSIPSKLINKKSQLALDGVGRIATESCLMNNNYVTRGYTKNGMLTLRATNYKPNTDIHLILWDDWRSYYMYSWDDKSCDLDKKIYDLTRMNIQKEDARLLRNYLFAVHGYVFKTEELQEYFEKQYWYFPDPDVKNDIAILNRFEKKLFNYIQSVQ